MNIENMNKLIALFAGMSPAKFDMDRWLSKPNDTPAGTFHAEELMSCGTVGCAGGWTVVLMKMERNEDLTFEPVNPRFYIDHRFHSLKEFQKAGEDDAAAWLGLSEDESFQLFYARGRPKHTSLSDVTLPMMLWVLRDMVDRGSGEADWKTAFARFYEPEL